MSRAKRGMNTHRVYSMKINRSKGIIFDKLSALEVFYTWKEYPEQSRRIRLKDTKIGRTVAFLTNKRMLAALTITALYK